MLLLLFLLLQLLSFPDRLGFLYVKLFPKARVGVIVSMQLVQLKSSLNEKLIMDVYVFFPM